VTQHAHNGALEHFTDVARAQVRERPEGELAFWFANRPA